MFKKKPTIKALSPLRSSDRRKLADQIIRDFNLDQIDTNQEQTPEEKAEATNARSLLRNSLFPDNTQSARFTTTQGADLKQVSGTVYVGSHEGEEGRILWFQVEGRLYPSVYSLWRNPGIIPLLHTPPVVITKLQGGADLMTPGLFGGPPFPSGAKKDAIVAVASTDRPSVPLVVGCCEVDVSALQNVRGAKGHAVRNLHWSGDEIWAFGATGRSGVVPPEDIDGWSGGLGSSDFSSDVASLDINDQDDEGGVPITNGASRDSKNDKITDDTRVGNDPTTNQSETPVREFSQKEVDECFRNAFLYGVHHYKTTNPTPPHFGLVFPLSPSFTMSNLIQPFLPAFSPEESQQLQIKKSSWKTIKKFIKSLDKERILKSKDKDGNETVILDIDFDDRAILDFKPYRLPKKETIGGASQGRGEKATEAIDTGDDSVGQRLKVVSFFKPTSKLQPLFATATKQLLSPAEVREIVTAYITSEQLVQENNRRLVKLDPILANNVFDGSSNLDKEVIAKGSIPRDALIDRVLHGMATSYAILRNSDDLTSAKAKSGAAPKVHITLETRSGNKTVTKVWGLETYFVNPKLLAEELRKVCAGSTSVEPLAGAAKKFEKPVEEVMIQGPQNEAVIKALQRRGIDRKWIEVVDKTKGKKR